MAIAVIALFTFINMRGLKMGKLIQNSFTFTKTAAFFALVLLGLFVGWNAGRRGFYLRLVEPCG